MTYLSLVIAIGLGYFIGLMQGGIHIYPNSISKTKNENYNESVGVDKFKDYYDETGGANDF